MSGSKLLEGVHDGGVVMGVGSGWGMGGGLGGEGGNRCCCWKYVRIVIDVVSKGEGFFYNVFELNIGGKVHEGVKLVRYW